MKSAEEIFNKMCEEMPWNFIGKKEIAPYILEAIKIAQHDIIDETCKVCAENAYAKPVSTITEGGHLMELWTVNEDSILNCAEILKKQIG